MKQPNVKPLKIGISCYPTIGGSGVVASNLGKELAERGHQVHFIAYDKPFRMDDNAPNTFFHQVVINDYDLFKYPDYTLPLSVKMAEVSRDHQLDILHVHYAVPHATAAILARCMLRCEHQPKVVTTLHGTDTTLLGKDPGYGPAIYHALTQSDAVTTVSEFLRDETLAVLGFEGDMQVIPNFYMPGEPTRTRQDVRDELGVTDDEVLLVHSSNLRPVKRVDVLLDTIAGIKTDKPFKLLILAGNSFAPFEAAAKRLGITDKIIVRESVSDIENYLQAADVGLMTSDTESFCLSILEAMFFAVPTVSTSVGGIPEVLEDSVTGYLCPQGDAELLAAKAQLLIEDKEKREELGRNAQVQARARFCTGVVVPQYEELYHGLLKAISARC